MQFVKKYWYLLGVLVVTLILGVVTFITSQQVAKKEAIAPTVAQITPFAAEPACTYNFTLTISPTLTPTPTPVCGEACGSGNSCPAGLSCYVNGSSKTCVLPDCITNGSQCSVNKCTVTPTPTATLTHTPTATITPTPNAQCGQSCVNGTCGSGLTCDTTTNLCILSTCSTNSALCNAEKCAVLPTATITPTTVGSTSTPTPTTVGATATPTTIINCNGVCQATTDCSSGMSCIGGVCRNPSCSSETSCVCTTAVNPTPTTATPQVPVAGATSPIGVSILLGGVLLLLVGLAF